MPTRVSLSPQSATSLAAADLNLIPYPHQIAARGGPWRALPSQFLHLPADALAGMRAKARVLAAQFSAAGYRTRLASSTLLTGFQAALSSSPTVSKDWPGQFRPLRGMCAKPEGYRLIIAGDAVLMLGADEQGFFYAGQTLLQLLENENQHSGMEIEDGPLTSYRAAHLDFRGWPPTRARLEETIDRLAHVKINLLIIEWERHFGYASQPGLSAPDALTPAEVSDLSLFAKERGVTLVPLLHCLGQAGHLLRLEPYREIREDPRYYQQMCPTNPATIEVFSAMAEELAAVHGDAFFHVGGDAARFLGLCPACNARARQLGGRSSLYLEYVGKVVNYLSGQGRAVLLWDEMIRTMSDEQIQWLPPAAIFLACQSMDQGDRATPDILVPLERYQKLGRRCWAGSPRSPAERFNAFDNLDAWAEAAELGYIEGLFTATWTREHTLGPLLPPADLFWPEAYYGAERAWSGRGRCRREEFHSRFIHRFFGPHDATARTQLWSVFDFLHRDHPREARAALQLAFESVRRGRDHLAFLDCWLALAAFHRYVQRFQDTVAAGYQNLRSGEADPFHAGRLRWRIEDLKAKAPGLAQIFRERATGFTSSACTDEFLHCELGYDLSRLDELAALLARYPMPDREWQQPIRL